MSTTASRMDSMMRKTREKIARRAAERARLAAEKPPCCDECGEPFPEGHPLRERALDRMQDGKRPMPMVCPTCLPAAQERAVAREAAEAQAERAAWIERIRRNLPRHLAQAGVPPVLLPARFDNCPDLPADLVERVRAWAEAPAGFVLLTGPVGSGKSWLAAAALAHVLSKGGRGRFASEHVWLAGVGNEYGRITMDVGPMASAFLAYDDLGTAYLNELRRGAIEGLLRKRHDHGRPTIITTNADLGTLDELLGSRVVSVIREYGNVLRCGDADLRQSGGLRPTGPRGAPLGDAQERGEGDK